MSTQSNGVPLSHFPDGVSYKLLELPAELVTLLESPNPPALTLTSSPTAALLTTPDGKTHSFRQKNTSNALIILSTSSTSNPDQGQGGLNAIATVHDTVELVAETEKDAKAPATAAKGKWHEKFGRSR